MNIAVVLSIIVCFLIVAFVRQQCQIWSLKEEMVETMASLGDGYVELKKGCAAALEQHEKVQSETIHALEKRMTEFEAAGLENMRAQADAEKAWAAGVQTIMGYGADIPHLKTGGVKSE